MANTPLRNIRIEDELWDAAKVTAEQNGTNVTEVIRKALTAYVRRGVATLVVVATALLLGACGGAEPAAQPVSEPTVAGSVTPAPTPSASPDVDLSQPGARREVVRRVDAGECFSISFGSSALEWSEWMSERPENTDESQWRSDFASWISGQPVGCHDTDRAALSVFG